jgi:dihydropteroate synthase
LAKIDLSGIKSLLDVGGGSGAYTMEFVSRKPEIEATVFAINMLVGTEAGDCYTENEVTEMLVGAGFTNISRIDFETGLSQMMAQRA